MRILLIADFAWEITALIINNIIIKVIPINGYASSISLSFLSIMYLKPN